MLLWICVIIVTVLEGRKKGWNWSRGERSAVWHSEYLWVAEKKFTKTVGLAIIPKVVMHTCKSTVYPDFY